MMKEEYRIEKAIELFKEGFNCSQAVVTAFADKYGFTKDNKDYLVLFVTFLENLNLVV